MSASEEAECWRAEILRLAEARGQGKSLFPSEVARRLWPEEAALRAAMPLSRAAGEGTERFGCDPDHD